MIRKSHVQSWGRLGSDIYAKGKLRSGLGRDVHRILPLPISPSNEFGLVKSERGSLGGLGMAGT